MKKIRATKRRTYTPAQKKNQLERLYVSTNIKEELLKALNTKIRGFRDIRWLNENIFEKVNFAAEGGGTESPVIVTLRSISERPQNISFLYEWEFFGYDKQNNKYNKITPKIPGTDGGEIFIPSQPNSLRTSGTDLKNLEVHLII